ncbi:MAG: hypothetical protein CSA44_01390 [Gammaproteobacteria bacterium]|nr:MAG: hypothetical protein CSA44_01390 [Gammaproteobacteria bacterium]
MKKLLLQFSSAALLSMALTVNVFAQTAEDALETVKKQVTVVLEDLKANKTHYQNNPAALNQMIDSKMVPYFDIDSMARLVLGKNWKNASETQRNEFLNEFKQLIMRTYSSSLLDYTNAKVTYGKLHEVTGKKRPRTQIDVTVTNSNGDVYPLMLKMAYNDGQWKGYDVSLDGLSVITSYRSSIGNEVAEKGIQAVIDEIKVLNEKGEVLNEKGEISK